MSSLKHFLSRLLIAAVLFSSNCFVCEVTTLPVQAAEAHSHQVDVIEECSGESVVNNDFHPIWGMQKITSESSGHPLAGDSCPMNDEANGGHISNFEAQVQQGSRSFSLGDTFPVVTQLLPSKVVYYETNLVNQPGLVDRKSNLTGTTIKKE